MNPIYTTFIILSTFSLVTTKKPNILLIVADDLGWNDVSWQNQNVVMPNLHSLYNKSVRLRNYYVQPTCSPSRAAMLTGMYPHKIGFSEQMPSGMTSGCLDTELVLLPQILKGEGYSTHLVGKWHVGFCDWKCTPTYRGFDTFYGMYDGHTDHYTHRHHAPWSIDSSHDGLDFRNNEDLVLDQNGTFSADSFTKRAIGIINRQEGPWFLDLSFTLPHFPIEAPERFAKVYEDYVNLTENRRKYLAMVTALDDAIGEVVKTMDDQNLWNETILIFTSDNGGEVVYGGNNWPLRGQKYGIFEGGTRSNAFIISPELHSMDYGGLFHVTDWFTTIQSAIGMNMSPTDSVNHWPNFLDEDLPFPRREMVYNIKNGSAAIQTGKYKLILGDPDPLIGSYDWYPEDFNNTIDETYVYPGNPEFENKLWLFDLENDQNERRNLADEEMFITEELLGKLKVHMVDYKPSKIGLFPKIKSGDPEDWGDAWSPGWCVAG